MGKIKLKKIKSATKKLNLIQNPLNENNRNTSSSYNFVNNINNKFSHKKRKIKKIKNKYDNSSKIISKNKINKVKNDLIKNDETDFIDDKIVCTHLLLNSYKNTNKNDFLPEKSIEQRINTIRGKLLSIFPDLITTN